MNHILPITQKKKFKAWFWVEIKWGPSCRWSFGLNAASTIGNTYSSLSSCKNSKNHERCQGNDGIDYRTFKEYKARNHASARIICKTHPRPLNKNSTFMFDSVFTTLSSVIQSNFNQSNQFVSRYFHIQIDKLERNGTTTSWNATNRKGNGIRSNGSRKETSSHDQRSIYVSYSRVPFPVGDHLDLSHHHEELCKVLMTIQDLIFSGVWRILWRILKLNQIRFKKV